MKIEDAYKGYRNILRRDASVAAAVDSTKERIFLKHKIFLRPREFQIFIQPHLMTEETSENLSKLTITLGRAATKAVNVILEDKELQGYLKIPKEALELYKIEHGYSPPVVIARFDGVFSKGRFKFFEINSDSPAMTGWGDALFPVFGNMPHFIKFRRKRKIYSFKLKFLNIIFYITTFPIS